MLTQILADLGTCLIVADLPAGRFRTRGEKRFCAAALCPFLANYAPPCSLKLWRSSLRARSRLRGGGSESVDEGRAEPKLWAATGRRSRLHLLRPDGGILLVAVVLYLAVRRIKGLPGFEAREHR